MTHVLEFWKPIVGFESSYAASNLGRIKRIPGKNCLNERVLSSKTRKDGYLALDLFRDGRPHTFLVHKLVAEAFLGPRPLDMTINHKDCVKSNNAIDNLEYITAAENIQHAYENGRFKPVKGERVGTARLTDDLVREIRAIPPSVSNRKIAVKYCVSPSCIKEVRNGTSWTHI